MTIFPYGSFILSSLRVKGNFFSLLFFNVIVLAGPSRDPDMLGIARYLAAYATRRSHYYRTWDRVPGSRERITSNGLTGGRASPSKILSANPAYNLQQPPISPRIMTMVPARAYKLLQAPPSMVWHLANQPYFALVSPQRQ